jgi:ribosomal protein S18 acetylase RimI-like enzyme
MSSYSEEAGAALHGTLAALASEIGWLAIDAGRGGESRSYLQEAISRARMVDDQRVEVQAFACLSLLTRESRPRESAQCAEAAQRVAAGWATPRLRVLLHLRAAHAYAHQQDRASFGREMATVKAFLDRGTSDDDLPFLQFVNVKEVTALEGLSLLALGRPAPAASAFRSTTDDVDSTLRRNDLQRHVLLAQAELQGGDAVESAQVALAVLPAVSELKSRRTSQLVGQLRRDLEPHRSAAGCGPSRMPMTQDVELIDEPAFTRYDADHAQLIKDQLVAVFLDVYAGAGPFYSEARFRRQLDGHMTVPGWSLVTAAADDEIVGYIYGFPLQPQSHWWDGMQTPVAEDFTAEDGHRTFALSELMVRSAWRRRGVAEALHEELVGGRPERRATLLVRPDNAPARAAYAKWGYRRVAELRPAWDDAPTFDVLVLDRSGE